MFYNFADNRSKKGIIFKCFSSLLNVITLNFVSIVVDFRLTLSQTTNFRLFQTERVCSQQFEV